jgi:hypothetical protein
MMHEKTIVQSRDRQGADPLADARGSVRISIFETAVKWIVKYVPNFIEGTGLRAPYSKGLNGYAG